jgi:DNA-directed RNA polymerase specialized sigma24 family protein
MEEMTKYLKALVYLQVQALAGASAFGKPELLLNKAGFKNREIAEMLGKKESAIAKSISRAKQSASEMTDE